MPNEICKQCGSNVELEEGDRIRLCINNGERHLTEKELEARKLRRRKTEQ